MLDSPEKTMKSRLKKRTPRYSCPSPIVVGLRVVRKNRKAVMNATMAHCTTRE
jgi:hypothetical protein